MDTRVQKLANKLINYSMKLNKKENISSIHWDWISNYNSMPHCWYPFI